MHHIGPLVAYLGALRGRVTSSSGSLDAARVKSFGLPYGLPGDYPANDLDHRIENFLAALKVAIDDLGPHDREVAWHYFFGAGSVEERNAAVATSLSASSSTARNSQGRMLPEVATRLLALSETRKTRTQYPEVLAEVVSIIAPSYTVNSDLDQLASMILSKRPAIEDSEIHLTMKDASDPTLYNLLITSTTSSRPGRFYLALTYRATLSDLVTTMCPAVAEAFTCSTASDVQRRAEEWTDRDCTLLTARGKDANGLTTRVPLPLEMLSDHDKAAVLEGLPVTDVKKMAVLAADVPDISGTGSLVPIEVRLPSAMERRDHYCYWMANRPTFVRQILVDWSGLALPDEQKVRLRSTIRTTAYEPHYDEDGGIFHVDGWLVAGQGILVTWG